MKGRVRRNGALSLIFLKSILRYDPVSGEFTWLVTRWRALAGTRAGTKRKLGYRVIGINNGLYTEHRLAWFYMTGVWPKHTVDHKNRVRDDNRWSNLRAATQMQNLHNAPKLGKARVVSPFRGVARRKSGAKLWWVASIVHCKRRYYIGQFATPEEASAAYEDQAQKFRGDFYG